MKKIKLYIATSLNGKIAKSDGGVEWLESMPVPEDSDYGYSEFYDSIDTTIQGNATYQQILGWGIDFPYAGKKNYVLTRDSALEDNEHVQFISEDHVSCVSQLKKGLGKDIWLIGGGQVNALLLEAGLIDEIIVHIMPIVLDDGIDIFGKMKTDSRLKLVSSHAYSTGVMELIYGIENSQ